MENIGEVLKRTTDTKAARIGIGAMESSHEVFNELFPGRKAVLVADTNTYEAAGRKVEKNLEDNGIAIEGKFVFDDPDLYAEWGYLTELEDYLKTVDAIPVAVGSGVINDLCKLSSHHLGRKYMIVGTAASMDGYTAYGASITYQGNKQTFDCPAPAGIIFDPEVAALAPKELAASGYADLLAKIPAGADWMLADAAGEEKLDKYAFGLVQDRIREALRDPDAILAGNVQATGHLADGLIMSGFAMQAINSSRPASGTEHQFSHFWDMEGLCINGKHVSHGFKVAIGTMVSTACLEYLLKQDIQNIDIDACVNAWPSWEKMEEYIRQIFKGKPGHLERGLTESRGKYIDAHQLRKELERIAAAWPQLKQRISAQIIPLWKIEDSLRRVGAPYRPEMIGVSREHLRDTFRCIPFMRNRYTNIDLIYRCHLMGKVEKHLFGKGGIWEV